MLLGVHHLEQYLAAVTFRHFLSDAYLSAVLLDGDVAQLVEHQTDTVLRQAEAGLIPWCGKGFFSQNQLSVQTLLQCLYSSLVQWHALTFVCTLKIPSTGSHTFAWIHENTTGTVRNG